MAEAAGPYSPRAAALRNLRGAFAAEAFAAAPAPGGEAATGGAATPGGEAAIDGAAAAAAAATGDEAAALQAEVVGLGLQSSGGSGASCDGQVFVVPVVSALRAQASRAASPCGDLLAGAPKAASPAAGREAAAGEGRAAAAHVAAVPATAALTGTGGAELNARFKYRPPACH